MKESRSITHKIYSDLRNELVTCKLRPGDKLRTSDLRERLGVSLSVVREALSRLVSESLVVADPQRGFKAAPMSATDLRQLSETTKGVEAMCIRSALAAADSDWEARLQHACELVEKAPLTDKKRSKTLSRSLINAHENFHEVLLSPTPNVWQMRLRAQLQTHAERYRYLCIPLVPAQEFTEAKTGHADITRAAIARDTELTIRLVTEQFERNVEYLANALERHENELPKVG